MSEVDLREDQEDGPIDMLLEDCFKQPDSCNKACERVVVALSPVEKIILQERAGVVPVSTYVRNILKELGCV